MKNRQDHFEANMSALKKNHLNLWRKFIDEPPAAIGEIVKAENGKANLRVVAGDGRVIYLHDQKDPETEVHQFLKLVSENSKGTVILQGMGLGYGALGILGQRKEIRHLIVFELSYAIFFQALNAVDLSPLLEDPRVILSVGDPPAVGKALNFAARSMRLEEVGILNHAPSAMLRADQYQALNTKIYTIANEMNIAGVTFKAYGKTFVSNRLSFLTMIHHTSLLDSLLGQFRDIPAVLVASGPSLEKNINLLTEFKGRGLIICVDSALPALLARGVQPDFITCIDYKPHIFDKIASSALDSKNASLICSSWVNKKVPKIFPSDNVFWAFAGGNMETWIYRSLGGKMKVPGAGTVAHMSLIAAITMKCSPIVLVGQDLSLPQESGRSDHITDTVISSDAKTQAMLKHKKDIQWVDANYGGTVPTIRQYYGHIKSFEMIMDNNPGHYINATEGGAYIRGTEVMAFQEVLDRHINKRYPISDLLLKIHKESKLTQIDELSVNLNRMKKQIDEIKKTIIKGDKAILGLKTRLSKLKKSSKRYHSYESLPSSLQKKIRSLDRYHEKLDGKHDFWALFDEATMGELQNTERMRFDIEKLEHVPERYLDWLLGNLKRLDKVNQAREKIIRDFGKVLLNIIGHHKSEKQLKTEIDAETDATVKQTLWIELARHHIEAGDFMVAKPILEILDKSGCDSPEFYFFTGMLAAHYMAYEKADEYFSKACAADESYQGKIEEFRRNLGDEYWEHANFTRHHSDKTYGYMVLKGLRYCSGHTLLLKELNTLVEKAITTLEASVESGDDGMVEAIDAKWTHVFEAQPELKEEIRPERLSRFFKTLGMGFHVMKDYLKAFEKFSQSLCHQKDDPELYLLMADVMQKMNMPEKAGEYFEKAVRIDGAFVRGYIENEEEGSRELIRKDVRKSREMVLKGNRLLLKGEADKAVKFYEDAFELDPGNSDAVHNLGKVFHDSGQLENAVKYYEKAIEIAPDSHSAYYNLGVAAQEMGKINDAATLFNRALELQPDMADAWNNLGSVLNLAGDYLKAIQCFEKVIEINPGYVDALNNIGVVYQSIGNLEKAMEYFKAFLEKKPDNPQALTNILNELQYACQWDDFKKYRKRALAIRTNGKPVIKPLQSLRITSDPAYHHEVACAWAPKKTDIVLVADTVEERERRHKKKKIRIGYLSSDIKDHAVAHILSTFIGHHDKTRFEIFCYSSCPENETLYRRKIRDGVEQFVDIFGLGNLEAANLIRKDDIDILVEMNGYTKGSRINVCAMRPAPVQVGYLGFLGTTGTDFIDYFITDKIVTPEDQAVYYTEKFAYLPECYQVSSFKAFASKQPFSRKAFGLPEDRTVFCSFNQPYKFDPEMFDTWMRILSRVPGSVLWLRQLSKTAEQNLRAYAEKMGISGARIVFSEKMELRDHLKRLELADIALDTRLYNGGATTNNALWAGLPVIALQGDSFVSRMSSSSLMAIGLPELVQESLEAYEAVTVSLALDNKRLTDIKKKIRLNRDSKPLFDVNKFVSDSEGLYETMWNRYLENNTPIQING